MEHRKGDLGDASGRAMAPDDAAQFLRELRQLRDDAGLEQTELAARAHYPYDLILAAEAGPGLPDLPVLSAYVRACGGTPEEWEERWRSLTKAPVHSELPTRAAGQSPAADAGARIGSSAPITDADPSAIIAALSRVAEEMAGSKPAVLPVRPEAATESFVPAAPAAGDPSVLEAVPSGTGPSGTGPSGTGPSGTGPSGTGAAAPDIPDFAADELVAAPKPSGWDPIRVSTAWPALPDTPATDKASAAPERLLAPGPWGAAPEPATRPARPARSSVSFTAPAAAPRSTDSAARAARMRIVVAAVVLLCVIVVLLAIFA